MGSSKMGFEWLDKRDKTGLKYTTWKLIARVKFPVCKLNIAVASLIPCWYQLRKRSSKSISTLLWFIPP